MTKRFELDGKVALVTGAGDGIGLSTARALVAKGARVAVVDHNAASAKAAVAELGEDRALALVVDVTDRDAMDLALHQVVERFGRLDVVVANAGITPPPGTLRMLQLEHFDRVMDVNVTGVLNTVVPAIEHLIESQGHVVVVASAAAFCPPVGGVAYMASKAAVEALGRGFKLELAPHGVSVTVSYFGVVETQLARVVLDEDELGEALNKLLPAPLRRRISAADAAGSIVSAVERRAATSMAPTAWIPLSLLRGVVTPVIDRYLVGNCSIHQLIRALEARHSNA